MTGSVDDPALVAARRRAAELRRRPPRGRRSPAEVQQFAVAVAAVVVAVVAAGLRHLHQAEEGQMLRTAFVQRFAGLSRWRLEAERTFIVLKSFNTICIFQL